MLIYPPSSPILLSAAPGNPRISLSSNSHNSLSTIKKWLNGYDNSSLLDNVFKYSILLKEIWNKQDKRLS